MTTTVLSPLLTQAFLDNTGKPLANGQLFTYIAGTNTPQATFTDSTGGTPNTNPVILNARGEASVWIPPNVAYKFVLEDALGNIVWTRDQVTQSQLLTLFGGVDTGSANAYQLSFTANFNALTNGITIYWVPANTNTGPSTLNVNGLGVVNIVNPNGSALGANEIIAGQIAEVVYYNGNWVLVLAAASTVQTGSFNATLTSGANTNVGTCKYVIQGPNAIVLVPFMNVTISGGLLTMTGWPAVLQPPSVIATVRMPLAQNNGSAIDTCLASISPASGTVQLSINATNYPSGGWAGSASIGLHVGAINYGQTISYGLF